MMTVDDLVSASAKCLDARISFAAYSSPDSKELCFFADDRVSRPSRSRPGDERFIIGYGDKSVAIESRLTARDIMSGRFVAPGPDDTDLNPWPESTERAVYVDGVSRLIGRLKENDHKVVVSRVLSECREGFRNRNWAEAAVRIMEAFAKAFGYMYFTPETGAWIGASPETLIDCDFDNRTFRTIALAGSRRAGSGAEWDEKNKHEHDFVVDHITNRLKKLGLRVKRHRSGTVKAGPIEHLMTKIDGEYGDLSPRQLIGAIHPTPAIVGFPVGEALDEIGRIEAHPRRCYGGYVVIESEHRFLSHVNLRCLQFWGERATFYGGGGITANSVAEDEWDETMLKISATRALV